MNLPDKPTIADYQEYLRNIVVERGFDKESVHEVFMIFIEEVGEFAKAIRKASGLKSSDDSRTHELSEEAADIFFMLVDLCNRLDIDLEKAFYEKEKKNKSRVWK